MTRREKITLVYIALIVAIAVIYGLALGVWVFAR